MLVVLQPLNLAIRFLLELCSLAALGYFGFHNQTGLFPKIAVGLGLPLLAAVIWATFGAPHAAIPATGPWIWVLEVVIFGSSVAALAASGHGKLSLVFAVVLVLNRALMYVWGQ